jgi:hypothetical protein
MVEYKLKSLGTNIEITIDNDVAENYIIKSNDIFINDIGFDDIGLIAQSHSLLCNNIEVLKIYDRGYIVKNNGNHKYYASLDLFDLFNEYYEKINIEMSKINWYKRN